MGSARDVIAACLADHWNRPEQWTGEQYADAVLAALAAAGYVVKACVCVYLTEGSQ